MNRSAVHPVEGKKPTERSLYTPQGLIVVIRNGLKRQRDAAKGPAVADFNVLLECLNDLERSLPAAD